jgi:hypothetical protein
VRLTDPSGMAPGGLDSSDPLPQDANASTIYEKDGVVYAPFLRKDGGRSWRAVSGISIGSDVRSHDLAVAVARRMEGFLGFGEREFGPSEHGIGTKAAKMIGGVVADFHPLMGFIKLGTGAEELNLMNFAFAAISLIPGGGEANAGKGVAKTVLKEGVEEVGEGGLRLVGRWMSRAEHGAMVNTGRVVEGGGGQTFVSANGMLDYMRQAAKGAVYVEFRVPTNSLLQGGVLGWYKAIGPAANASMRNAIAKQGGELLPQFYDLSGIIHVK